MRKRFTVVVLGIFIFYISCTLTIGADSELTVENHNIYITKETDALEIKEDLILWNISYEQFKTIPIWLSDKAMNVKILVNNNEISFTPIGSNLYLCNISSLDIPGNISIRLTISYVFPKNSIEFEKKLTFRTTNLNVEFNNKQIYTSNHLTENVSFVLLLYEPTETPISWYIIVTIALLVIFLGVTTYYSFRKQKSYKIKEIGSESEELLQAKKNLLMSLLKDLEKQHRANKISDDTHHKLKADFKQQTVETMGKLEKIKSED